jgi:hypothetical protein
MFNQPTKTTMSKPQLIALRVMQVWTVCVAAIAISGILFAIASLVTGNYSSTSAFEF